MLQILVIHTGISHIISQPNRRIIIMYINPRQNIRADTNRTGIHFQTAHCITEVLTISRKLSITLHITNHIIPLKTRYIGIVVHHVNRQHVTCLNLFHHQTQGIIQARQFLILIKGFYNPMVIIPRGTPEPIAKTQEPNRSIKSSLNRTFWRISIRK